MNTLSVASVGCALLLACGASYGAPAEPQDTGRIFFTGKNSMDEPGGKSCSLSITKGDTFMGDTACKNDEVYFYRFDNVPSATLVTLDAENTCRSASNPGDWQFVLRSYINPTTTEWKRVSDLQSLGAGNIVTAGVLFEQGYHRQGAVGGKLSCVRIRP
nr:hypothetical protein [uncultured Pseudomonas sp.]